PLPLGVSARSPCMRDLMVPLAVTCAGPASGPALVLSLKALPMAISAENVTSDALAVHLTVQGLATVQVMLYLSAWLCLENVIEVPVPPVMVVVNGLAPAVLVGV